MKTVFYGLDTEPSRSRNRNRILSQVGTGTELTIYAPVFYIAPCIMFWMGAYTLRGEVGGGWALEFPSFLGPVKWERADRRVPFHLK